MGNQIMGDNIPDSPSKESRRLVKNLRKSLTMQGLVDVLLDY